MDECKPRPGGPLLSKNFLMFVCAGLVFFGISTHMAGRGLHSSTLGLNVSAFCGMGGASRGGLGGV